MLKYVIWLSLACSTLSIAIEASPVANSRHTRSIWPFSSSSPSLKSFISEKNAAILRKAGLEKSLDLSSHPIWKIHKYEGIDVKPVRIEAEVIKADPKAIGIPSTESSVSSTEAPVDLSFLDNLGGLAYFLPNSKSEEEKASERIVEAIKKEEASHPGFFKKLWRKLWGKSAAKAEGEAATDKRPESGFLASLFGFGEKPVEESDDEDKILTIYLPETQGSYAAVFLPEQQVSGQDATQLNVLFPGQDAVAQESKKVDNGAPIRFETLPSNHANQFTQPLAEEAPAPRNPIQEKSVAEPVAEPVAQPVAEPVAQPVAVPANAEFSRSQAWIQSWTPHAAYSVHVQGPASTDRAPETTSPFPESSETPQEQDTDAYQRKSSEGEDKNDGIDRAGGQVQESADRQEVTVEKKDTRVDAGDRGRDILLGLNLPEALLKKFQVNPKDVEAILNNKDSAARASERLRALQREFEMRKDQLSYAYSNARKLNSE